MRRPLTPLLALALCAGRAAPGPVAAAPTDLVRVSARGSAAAPVSALHLRAGLDAHDPVAADAMAAANERLLRARRDLERTPGLETRALGARPAHRAASDGNMAAAMLRRAAGGQVMVTRRTVTGGPADPGAFRVRAELEVGRRGLGADRAARAADLMDAARAAGLSVGALDAEVADRDALEDAALAQALSIARRRAGVLAELAGRRLGPVRGVAAGAGRPRVAGAVESLEIEMEVTVEFVLE